MPLKLTDNPFVYKEGLSNRISGFSFCYNERSTLSNFQESHRLSHFPHLRGSTGYCSTQTLIIGM